MKYLLLYEVIYMDIHNRLVPSVSEEEFVQIIKSSAENICLSFGGVIISVKTFSCEVDSKLG